MNKGSLPGTTLVIAKGDFESLIFGHVELSEFCDCKINFVRLTSGRQSARQVIVNYDP